MYLCNLCQFCEFCADETSKGKVSYSNILYIYIYKISIQMCFYGAYTQFKIKENSHLKT